MKDYGRDFVGTVLIEESATINSAKITGDYGSAGTDGLVANIYFGTAATMGTSGVPDGSLYFQYTA